MVVEIDRVKKRMEGENRGLRAYFAKLSTQHHVM
jgi:hypothetical protein